MGNSESFDLLSISEYKNSTKKKHATHHLNSQFISPALNSITSFDLNGIFRKLSDDITDFKTAPIDTAKKNSSSVKVSNDKINLVVKTEAVAGQLKAEQVIDEVKEECINDCEENKLASDSTDDPIEVEVVIKDCPVAENEEPDIVPLEDIETNKEQQDSLQNTAEGLIKETLESESEASVISRTSSSNEKNQ